jgi:phage tail protein X
VIAVFGKLSRYRTVPDVAVPDADGRVLASKGLRPLPDVTGTFLHTVDAGDRLDQLAFKYYGQSLTYWHICDANPQFLSPLALLDQEPVVSTRFPLTVTSEPAPWAPLLDVLSRTVGVEDVAVQDEIALVPQWQVVNGRTVTVQQQRPVRSVRVTYNRLNLATDAVAGLIRAAGFGVGAPSDAGQLGQPIVIPPAVSG